jgi:hypothetical protein
MTLSLSTKLIAFGKWTNMEVKLEYVIGINLPTSRYVTIPFVEISQRTLP